MNSSKKINSDEKLRHLRKDDKEKNERCFPPNNDTLNYHSIILVELIESDNFDNLIQGLKSLYKDSNVIDYNNVEIAINTIQNQKNKLFTSAWKLFLPTISDIGNTTPNMVSHDLGEFFKFVNLGLEGVSPSMIILSIRADLKDVATEKLNDILCKYHDSDFELVETERGAYEEHFGPSNIKYFEISKLKGEIKGSLLGFIAKFFDGFFLNLWMKDNEDLKINENIKIIPCIDLYSLSFPENNEELMKWARENNDFLYCISISLWNNIFKNENFIIGQKEFHYGGKINNYFILSKATEDELDSFTYCSFSLLGIERFTTQMELIFGDIHSILSNEITKLKENEFEELIETRKNIFNEIFHFERFKTEINQYWEYVDYCEFSSITNRTQFFSTIQNNIKNRLLILDNYIKYSYKHSDYNFNLASVEHNDKVQNNVIWLSIIVLVLTIIQALLAYVQFTKP